jgi:putative ABC transport system permease protein
VSVPLHPSVTACVIVLTVVLAVAGALLAGSFGSWRIARLRPADALTRGGLTRSRHHHLPAGEHWCTA